MNKADSCSLDDHVDVVDRAGRFAGLQPMGSTAATFGCCPAQMGPCVHVRPTNATESPDAYAAAVSQQAGEAAVANDLA
jgi:hypothetical protein